MIRYERTKNSVRNIIFGLVLKIISIVGAFAVRTILIYQLGVEYVGLDGLFSSILTILSMAEMGFSSAIVFKLYKPIADNNAELISKLLNYYRKIYRIIGFIVFLIGIAILPFLTIFIRGDAPGNINLYLLYSIYLLNTCLSYWLFAYKSALLYAHQRNDLISKVTSFVYILKYVIQCSLLLVFKNYYVYAFAIPATTLLVNVGNAIVCNKYYPQYSCKGELNDSDKIEIKNKVTALLFNKIGVALINGSDNIVISSFLGLSVLGIYDSYYYIFTMLYGIFEVFHSAITGGIGNRIVTESKKDNLKLFYNLSFINYWLVSWCSICLACLYKPFMTLWVGSKNTFPEGYSVVMAVFFYFWMIRFIVNIFKNAQGLWWQDRFRALTEAGLNLTLNLVMVRFIGIYGITLSTIIAMLVVSLFWETNVLFKMYFEISTVYYFRTFFIGFFITAFIGLLTYNICGLIKNDNVFAFVVRCVICVIIPNVLLYIIYRKTQYPQYTLQTLLRIIKGKERKNING